MTRTENITLTVFNPETEEYEDIRARVEFSLYVGRIEPLRLMNTIGTFYGLKALIG